MVLSRWENSASGKQRDSKITYRRSTELTAGTQA